ncbi:MAG: SGNH/GDSL hydrolase family protein [Chitinophagaceae bacterium]
MKLPLAFLVIVLTVSSFSRKEILWVAIGDSITYLNEHADETGNRVTKGYMTRVVDKLSNVHYINQGHNGWTSGRIADSIDKLHLQKADVYSLFLGTNDWWQGRPTGNLTDYQHNTGNKTVYGSFRIIINKLRTLNENAHIILITPMQRLDFVYINNPKNNAYGSYKDKAGQSLEKFAQAIDSIGKLEQFDVIDLYHDRRLKLKNLVKYKRLKDPQTGEYKNYRYPRFLEIPFKPESDEYPYPATAIGLTYDGLHPSDKGNAIIAARLRKVLKRY